MFKKNNLQISRGLLASYVWMALGLIITGLVATGVARSEFFGTLVSSPFSLLFLIATQLGLAFGLLSIANRAPTWAVAAMFIGYAVLTGIVFSTLFLVYTASSIGAVFFITAGTFIGLSIVGFFIKTDLSAIGRFAIFALIGLILTMIVNIFLHSTGLQFLISIAGVLVFGVLTAYDTQKLKDLFASGEADANMPLVGALILYLDFINMFLNLLSLFGDRD